MYKDLIGAKYKIHGRTKEEGLDCWGVVLYRYKELGIELPDPNYTSIKEYSDTYKELTKKIKYLRIEKPEKDCIILINVHNQPSHCGVYIGNGLFMHSVINYGVVIDSVVNWEKRIEGFYKAVIN